MVFSTGHERTPLLLSGRPEPSKPTPIPWAQFSIVLVIQLAEPLTYTVMYPFAPQLIRDIGITHGNEARVGFYVGLLQSVFYLAEAVTILQWSRTSDHIGRKPVILIGLLGLSMSMYSFGLSKSFAGLMTSRILNGVLNGNIGVMKSMMVELSDPSNIAQIYSSVPLSWAVGGSMGPVIGGFLSNPADQFPALFGHNDFLKAYPYFLPCAIVATFTAIVWLVVLFFLRETLKKPISIAEFLSVRRGPSLSGARDGELEPSLCQLPECERPVPLCQLFTMRVIVAGGSYAACSLLEIAFRAIQSVFFATPVAFGGLGLAPSTIGRILTAFAIINGITQMFLFPKFHNAWGSKVTYITGILCGLPMFLCFPIMSLLVQEQGLSPVVWTLVVVQTLAFIGLCFAFGASFVFITASSPNQASLGATNGLTQMSVSVARAIGPALATSFFSLSMERNSFLVYYVLISLVFWALWIGYLLPRIPWKS